MGCPAEWAEVMACAGQQVATSTSYDLLLDLARNVVAAVVLDLEFEEEVDVVAYCRAAIDHRAGWCMPNYSEQTRQSLAEAMGAAWSGFPRKTEPSASFR